MKEKLRYREAAALLHMPVGTLYALVSRRQIPHIRLSPRLVLFDRETLEKWLQAHEVSVAR